jgi:YesN/AraC family two-component response regulator
MAMDWVSGRYSMSQIAERYGITPAYASTLFRKNKKMQELLQFHLEQLRMNIARGQMLVGQKFADIVQHGLNLAENASSESVQAPT